MKKIAIEEHISAPEFMALRYTTPRGKARPFPLPKEEIDRIGPLVCDEAVIRLENMEKNNISIQLLMSASLGFDYIDDPDEALLQTSRFNNYLSEKIIKKYPEKFKAFGSIPLCSPEKAALELRRCVEELGFLGAMFSGIQRDGRYIDAEEYDPLWKTAEELGAFMYIHPAETPDNATAHYDGYKCMNGSTWSWGVDTASYVLRLIFSGLLDKYPNLKIIMGHLGEMLPYVMERLDTRWSISPMDSKNKEKPSYYFKKNILISTSGSASVPALKCAIDVLGEDRIMFAVDYPFESNEYFCKFIDNADLSEDVKEKICYKNAEMWFGLSD